jgi:CubicO group peptidase (beta-lactamase class C family)
LALLVAGLSVCGSAVESFATEVRRPTGRVIPSGLRNSTPEAQGLDPVELAAAYDAAGRIPRIYSMLVLRNGFLVSEQYFNGQSRVRRNPVASVTKSMVSALVGLALEDGLIPSLDSRMMDYFPEYDTGSLDPRKRSITIRQLLQMRAGYPTDNIPSFYDSLFSSGNWLRFIIIEHPLETDPGSAWFYSSASAHVLSGILTKASDESVYRFARDRLFEPLGVPAPYWPRDPQGYAVGYGDTLCSARQLAIFGQIYLDGGVFNGVRVLSEEWIEESFRDYSSTPYGDFGPYEDIRYGYLWWHAGVDGHDVHFAWGHGGNFIMIVPDLDMVVVTTAFNFAGDFTSSSWETEGAIFFLIAEQVIPTAY